MTKGPPSVGIVTEALGADNQLLHDEHHNVPSWDQAEEASEAYKIHMQTDVLNE